MKALLEKIRKILRSRGTRQMVTRSVSVVAAVVVFVTTYALVLPAITMEQNASCGIPEHQHTDACYEEQLVCGIPEGQGHHHDVSCYEKILICGLEAHVHSPECYQQGNSAAFSAGSGDSVTNVSMASAQSDVLYGTDGSEYDPDAPVTDGSAVGEEGMEGFAAEESAAEESASDQTAAEEPGAEQSVPVGSDTEGSAAGEAASGVTVPDGSASGAASENVSADETVTAPAGDTSGETASEESAAAASTASSTASYQGTAAAAQEMVGAEVGSYQPGTLTAEGSGYKIRLDYTEKAMIPQNAELSVREITAETDKEAYEACLEQARQQVAADDNTSVDRKVSRFFDIEILVRDTDSMGNEEIRKIEPSAPVSVNIQIIEDQTAENDTASADQKAGQTDPAVLHFAEEGVEQLDAEVKESQAQEQKGDKDKNTGKGSEPTAPATEISFEAESFSIYAVVYTVDFHWEVNGKEYEFSIPGGGYVSFTDLMEVLGVADGTNSEGDKDENGTDIAEKASENNANERGQETDIGSQAESEEKGSAPLTLDNIDVSDDTREFVSDVASVEFSSPELVDISKVETDTTVGKIKKNRGLDVQYSEELTEEQIEGINSQTVEPGDWALISLLPFTSEETLTVTMKDGEVFTIRVTDYQISTNVLTADGKNYKITVTYDDDAEIPAGAELRVYEITDAAKYKKYVTKTQEALGRETDDSRDRFFDISIVDRDGNEIRPSAAVSVEIRLLDTEIADSTQVVHFGKTAELMDLQRTSDSLNFQTDGFSVFAVVVVESEEGSYVFRGDGFTVTITHTAEAQIPLGTTLTVEELNPESDDYIQRLGQAWYEVNHEYFEVEAMRSNYNESMGDLPELSLINLDHTRFFNISLVYEGEEIEPHMPVQVEIAYDDGMTMAGESVSGVVSYTGDEVELVEEVDTVTEGSDVLAFKYEQTNISDTGTYVGQKTYDEVAEPVVLPAPAPMQYPMLQKKTAVKKALKAAGNGKDEEGEKGEKKGEEADLTAPLATKTLTPNKAGNTNDGTYTLELAVDGRAKSSTTTEIKKSNVLIVMDRSSSMINNIAAADVTQVAWHSDGGWGQPTPGYYQYGVSGNRPWTPEEGVTYYGYIDSNGGNRYRELFYSNGQFYYYDSQGVTTATTRSYTGKIYTSTTRTRLDEEQEALDKLIYDLLAKNGEGTTDEGVSLEDIIEISVISFAKDRMDQNDGTAHLSSEQDWSTSYSDLINAVNDPYAPSGTNWEQALKYAMEEITAKKANQTQAGEDYYLLFLTDGEPTATTEHHSGAYYYDGSSHGGFDNAYNPARAYIRDESGIAAAEDIHFYGIMTWATNDVMRKYLKRLVNVGNGNVANETDYTTEAVDEDGVDDYYYDADSLSKLEEVFSKIFNLISNNIAYEQVSITDGLTTDAMTTTLVNGSAKGFQYTVYKDRVVDADGKIVSKGTPVYTVIATDGEGGEPNVTFYIGENEYTGDDVQKKAYEYDELQDDGTTLVHKTKYYYSVTVGEGENAHEYKMTLAEKTHDAQNGDRLDWDLAAIGALEDGYTYAVSFTVWPDQDAYDYVAALNNGLKKIKDSSGEEIEVKWDPSVETDENKVTDSNGKSYWKGGASPAYPSIIKYTDGTYAVLTNTDQKLKYTITKTETVNGETTVTHEGPYTPDLPSPDPMPLTGTASQLEKVWNINRDPSILYKYLYESRDDQGNPVAFDIGFEIKQDEKLYKEVNLPGKATVTAEGVTYDWSAYKDEDLVEYNGKTFSKRWSQDFSISTGLMLSEAQMDARNLDKSLYTDNYLVGNTRYYVLEPGHDFKISEPAVGYEFDFEEPTYHPMLVDGVLMDVKFTTDGGTKRISGMKALEIDTPTGKSALTVLNTLRGYINVKKKVVDSDGITELTKDNTEFTFEVELTNDLPVFEGDHIPWYGINGLYYHDVDADDNYYQAEYKNGELQVTTEEGGPYEGVGTTFNPDYADAQTIEYYVDGQKKSVTICGNQTTPDEGSAAEGYKKVTGTAKITRAETLYIANVPVNTHYTIKETGLTALGYQLIDIERQVGANASAAVPVNIDAEINGEIVQNTETLITYTNKCLVTDINIQKVDERGKGLEGAVFRLKKLNGLEEIDASTIESVSGLGKVTKKIDGKTVEYTSAFETTDGVQTIHGLPDGTYKLEEVYVPAGYITTVKYIKFDIENRVMKNVTTNTEDASTIDFTAAGENSLALLKIENTPGAALPNTGGPGTCMIYLSGMALICLATAGLVMKRRQKAA